MYNKIKEIETYGAKARGKSELIKSLKGEKLTQRQGIKAKCYDCMGYYVDGAVFCESKTCPLVAFNTYNPNKIKSRTVSDEQKEKSRIRMTEWQKNK